MNRWDTLPWFCTADMAKQMINGIYGADEVKRMVNKIYGAEAFGIKEDTKMNAAQDVNVKRAVDNTRRNIMNKLKVGDKVSYTNYYKTPNRIPTLKRIIISKKAGVTVVLWDDGTKTIVKCSEADTYDVYAAYCAAFAKKCYGTNSQLKKTIEKFTVHQEEKETGGLPTAEEFAESMRKVGEAFRKSILEGE